MFEIPVSQRGGPGACYREMTKCCELRFKCHSHVLCMNLYVDRTERSFRLVNLDLVEQNSIVHAHRLCTDLSLLIAMM